MFSKKSVKEKGKLSSEEQDAPYSYIPFGENLSDKNLSSIPHDDFDKLNNEITNALTEQDGVRAQLYAKKMTLYYGVPGLLYLFELDLQSINEQRTAGELAESDAFNALTHLYLAQVIYQKDPMAKKIMSEHTTAFDNVSSRNFWREKSIKLMRIYPNLRKTDLEARKIAISIYQRGAQEGEEEGEQESTRPRF